MLDLCSLWDRAGLNANCRNALVRLIVYVLIKLALRAAIAARTKVNAKVGRADPKALLHSGSR